jgi:AcrR family transcriptional regulator
LENKGNIEAKERILNASIELFSQKGFDAASVNEIAEQANVTKALIYYYFKSKEEILDYLVRSLSESIKSTAMDFINANIVQMIKEGRLDILPDRLRFTDEQSRKHFSRNIKACFEDILDYAVENRAVIRILTLESLKNSRHHNDLLKLMELIKSNNDNELFNTISEADNDFNFSADMMLFQFFFVSIPLFNFAAYYDDYKKLSGFSDEEIRRSFLQSFKLIADSLISGNDILLRNKNSVD